MIVFHTLGKNLRQHVAVTLVQICDSNRQLCDTCNSWEAPGALITSCWECRTSVHATEGMALNEKRSLTRVLRMIADWKMVDIALTA